jgi:hypothetical protein
LPVTITDVVSTPGGGYLFHFTVSDGRHRDALIGTVTFDEATGIANGKNGGDVFSMCRAITESSDHQALVGRTFADAGQT